VREQLRLALAERPQQHVAALPRGRRRAALLLRVHAAVGELERRLGVVRVAGQVDHAHRRVDPEALALLAERIRRAHEHRAGARRRHQHAELVAAHPVRAGAAVHRGP
jgi:hypothetical protein